MTRTRWRPLDAPRGEPGTLRPKPEAGLGLAPLPPRQRWHAERPRRQTVHSTHHVHASLLFFSLRAGVWAVRTRTVAAQDRIRIGARESDAVQRTDAGEPARRLLRAEVVLSWSERGQLDHIKDCLAVLDLRSFGDAIGDLRGDLGGVDAAGEHPNREHAAARRRCSECHQHSRRLCSPDCDASSERAGAWTTEPASPRSPQSLEAPESPAAPPATSRDIVLASAPPMPISRG